MKIRKLVCLMADGDGGGNAPAPAPTPTPVDWRSSLPAEIKDAPVLKVVPDVATLAKNYVHAESLIGAKRLVIPDDKSGPEVWATAFDALGRPKTPDEYKCPEVKLVDGVKLDENSLKEFKSQAHQLGMSTKQFDGLMQFYLGGLNKTATAAAESFKQAQSQATEALKAEWGDKFNANLDIAKSVLKKFGDDNVVAEIEGGLGNNTNVVKMFHKIGTMMLEDRSSGSGGLPVGGEAQAMQEIDQMRLDGSFQSALNDTKNPGHRAAVDRWMEVHRRAYPGKVE